MAIVSIDIFDIVDPQPGDVGIVKDALSFVRSDIVYADLMPRQSVEFVDSIPVTNAGVKPEALYPGGNRIILRRLHRRDGTIDTYRMMGNFLHETGHSVDRWDLPWGKELKVLDLFVNKPTGTTWRNVPGLTGVDEYWKLPYESFCDWWVRGITNGQVISHWEYKRLKIPLSDLDKMLTIITTPPIFEDKGDVPEIPPPVVVPPEEDDEMQLLTNGVNDEFVRLTMGTPMLHPTTLALVTKAAVTGEWKVVGKSPDAKYVGVLVRTSKLAGAKGLTTLLVETSKVGGAFTVKPTVPKSQFDAAEAENAALRAENAELTQQLEAAQPELAKLDQIEAIIAP